MKFRKLTFQINTIMLAALLATVVAPVNAAIVENEPIVWWDFNSYTGNGADVVDVMQGIALSSSNGNVSSIMRSAGDYAADFSANDAFFNNVSTGVPGIAGAYAIEFDVWIPAESPSAGQYIAATGHNEQAIIYGYSGTEIELYKNPRTNGGPSGLNDGQWHKMVIGSYGNADLSQGWVDKRVYSLDGGSLQPLTYQSGTDLSYLNLGMIGIGGPSDVAADFFSGAVDNFAVYDLSTSVSDWNGNIETQLDAAVMAIANDQQRVITEPVVDPTPNRAFDVPEIGAVAIDGDLNDWADSTEWSEPFVLWNGSPEDATTKAKFAWNNASDMLYVAIQTNHTLGGHAVVGVGINVDDVPTTAVGSTQLAFDPDTGTTVNIMNEIQYYGDKYTSLGWPDSGTNDVVAAQTNDGITWTYELAIPYWKNWTTMSERQTISVDDEYYVYIVMEDALEGGNGTDMTYVGNPNFAGGAFDVAAALTFVAPLAGDANRDGKVDGSDVTILAGNWQKGVSDGQAAIWDDGDFNGDGKVDGSDVTILAGNWQAGVEAAMTSVPEPSTIALLIAAVVTLLGIVRQRKNR